LLSATLALVVPVDISTDCEVSLLFAVVKFVDTTVETLNALLSATLALVVPVDMSVDCEVSLLFAVVRLVDTTVDTLNALESATLAFVVPVDMSVDCEVSLLVKPDVVAVTPDIAAEMELESCVASPDRFADMMVDRDVARLTSDDAPVLSLTASEDKFADMIVDRDTALLISEECPVLSDIASALDKLTALLSATLAAVRAVASFWLPAGSIPAASVSIVSIASA